MDSAQADSAPRRGPQDLPVIQKWMQAVITHPGGARAGVNSDEAKGWIDLDDAGLESVVTPSQKRTSLQRLEVYAHAYYARLIECLRGIFPVFAKTVGDEAFDQFALAYLQRFPSQSYTLNELGANFAPFLEETNPTRGTDALGFEDFLTELAVVEWSIDRVFDGPGFEGQEVVSPAMLEGLSPEAFWEAKLPTVPCLRVHSFAFPVNDYFSAAKEGAGALWPEPAPSWLALTRRDFVVRRVPLTWFQYHVLARLSWGYTVGRAIEDALVETGETEDLQEVLAAAFAKFAQEQLFVRLELAPG